MVIAAGITIGLSVSTSATHEPGALSGFAAIHVDMYDAANAQQGMTLPLRTGRATCVTLLSSLILQTSDFSPRSVPRGLLDTTVQSQLAQITQFISSAPHTARGIQCGRH